MPKVKPLPDQETLKRLLDYDPETGALTWRARTPDMFQSHINTRRTPNHLCSIWNARYARRPAGSSNRNGYIVIAVDGVDYKAHRLAFKIATGADPIEVDHVDGNRANNKISNLRSVSRRENTRNAKLREDNKTGRTGVYPARKRGMWIAVASHDGKTINLGSWKSFELAEAARFGAERVIGFSERHGKRNI